MLRVALVLAATVLIPVHGKPRKYGAHVPKVYWKRENECAKTDCKGINSDENDNCLSGCVSVACHQEVYAEMPLEPGEIDKPRQSRFNACVRKEYDEEKKRTVEERKQR